MPTAKKSASPWRPTPPDLVPAGQRRHWTPDEDAALITAYRQGQTLAEIAEQLGCKGFHVWDRAAVLRTEGHDLPPRKPPWTAERRKRLAKLRRQGRSLRELEAEFEVTRGSITSQLRTLKRDGYDLGPGGYPSK